MVNASFIESMPKVELNVSLEGSIHRPTLMMLAERNEIAESLKHFDDWAKLMSEPNYARTYEIVRMACSWMKQPDDLTHIVYDAATNLAKQNVRYAEMSVNPAWYADLPLTFDDFLAAINDGRDRAQRAWGIDLAWVFTIPREEPRRADELARWVSTAAARRGGVVALGVSGEEAAQPVGQFERAFKTVEKKDIARVVRVGEKGVESIMQAVEVLNPTRLIDGWGVADSPDALTMLIDNAITLEISLTRAYKQGWIENLADYPLRKLYNEGVSLVIGSDMASVYQTTLNDEYLAAVEAGDLSQDEFENLALNAVRLSLLDDERKVEMLASFEQSYAELKAEVEEPAS